MQERINPQKSAGTEREEHVETKLHRIFLGSAILCALIVLELVFIAGYSNLLPALVRVSFFSLLLWSLAVTCYSFHTLWGISQSRKTRLEEIRRRDTITDAYTEDYLRERLEQERQRALETGKASAAGYVRICGLEGVNESYGHTAGNVVLRDLVRLMMAGVPPDSVVARLSGLEFFILIPQATLQDGESVLRGVREAISHYRLDLGERGSIKGLSANIGIAVHPCDGETAPDLTRVARRKTVDFRASILDATVLRAKRQLH